MEIWAGLLALSELFEARGGEVVAICESEETLLGLAKVAHPTALLQGDFYDLNWDRWAYQLGVESTVGAAVDILTGGPLCVTLSSAGKMGM